MANYAKIEGGVVKNTLVADEDYAAQEGLVLLEPGFGVSDFFSEGVFSKNTEKLTQEAENSMRSQRDTLLAESDLFMLPDKWDALSAASQQALVAYRQSLRDVPQNSPDVFNPKFPELWTATQ
tara:strand:+ start:232 stop:600 length:369 start_codon:yes stop_codon:yes gene_type:complete